MNTKGKRAIRVLIVWAMALGMVFMATPVPGGGGLAYAATGVAFSGATSVVQGETGAVLSYSITGEIPTYDYVELEFSKTVKGLTIGTVEMSADRSSGSFKISVSKSTDTGTYYFQLVLRSGGAEGTEVYRSQEKSFEISELASTPNSTSGKSITAMDITYSIQPATGFLPGKDNSITFEAFNKGNMMIRDAQFMLTLPEGLSVYNDSNTLSLGYLNSGSRRSMTFPIYVDEEIESKLYPVTVQLTGFNYTDGEGATKEKTFYIPVEGDEDSTVTVQDLTISNVSAPSEVHGTDPFSLSFSVGNKGSKTVKDVRISLKLPEGVLNRTVTSFAENTLAAGAVRNYSVSLFASADAEKKNYPIEIIVQTLGEEGGQIAQYAGVYIIPDEEGNVKKPQLMVSQYSYSGSNVQAGASFPLSLSLFNTSGKTISNIKVTLTEADGQIVPMDSNAFFIERIGAKETYTRVLRFNVKPQAEQKTTMMTVAMAYEDGNENEYTAEDIISIPITQETKLVVDDIIPPYEVYVGQPGAAEVQFYNMGKNTLGNLKVTAEGNFDVFESNSYFAGNMESGKSDTYTFTFTPREVGQMEGVVTFSYEDTVGALQYLEIPFVFQVVEMPVWEEEYPNGEEEQAKIPTSVIIAGIAAVLLIAGIIIWRKVRKARLHKAMEIADANWEKSMELADEEEPKDLKV